MRKNRRDPDNPEHDALWAEPSRYTRAARREAGYRERVHLSREESILPRYARRHWKSLLVDNQTRRVRKARARIGRLLAATSMEFV